jgi:hypothetical protein
MNYTCASIHWQSLDVWTITKSSETHEVMAYFPLYNLQSGFSFPLAVTDVSYFDEAKHGVGPSGPIVPTGSHRPPSGWIFWLFNHYSQPPHIQLGIELALVVRELVGGKCVWDQLMSRLDCIVLGETSADWHYCSMNTKVYMGFCRYRMFWYILNFLFSLRLMFWLVTWITTGLA